MQDEMYKIDKIWALIIWMLICLLPKIIYITCDNIVNLFIEQGKKYGRFIEK